MFYSSMNVKSEMTLKILSSSDYSSKNEIPTRNPKGKTNKRVLIRMSLFGFM